MLPWLGTVAGLLFVTLGVLLLRATPLLAALAPSTTRAAAVLMSPAASWSRSSRGSARTRSLVLGLTARRDLLALHYSVFSARGFEPVQRMAVPLLAARQGDQLSGTHRVFVRNLIFYTGVRQTDFHDSIDLATFLGQPDRVLCVLRQSDLERLQRERGMHPRVLSSISYINTAGLRLKSLLWPNPERGPGNRPPCDERRGGRMLTVRWTSMPLTLARRYTGTCRPCPRRSPPARVRRISTSCPDDWVRCVACGHGCRIPPGATASAGSASTKAAGCSCPAATSAGAAVRPDREEAVLPRLPGGAGLQFGMLGCDYHCGYCQNWVTSRRCATREAVAPPARHRRPTELVARRAAARRPRRRVSTYNEPLITSEWAVDVFKRGAAAGLASPTSPTATARRRCSTTSAPWVDVYKVDLKSFNDRQLPRARRTLRAVLDTIRVLHARGFWVEIVTLVVPGFNDDDEELRELGRLPRRRLARHAVAHDGVPPGLQDDGPDNTTPAMLLRAAEIGAPRRGCASSTPATCRAASGRWRTPTAPAAAHCSSSASATAC